MSSLENAVQPKTRDLSLDVLKGLGCLLMIMAHMPFKLGWYKDLTFLGGFAPVPFYAVVGVTAFFQAQKYLPRPVILNYLVLFFLGFALNGFNSPDFLRPPVIHFDIIQVIAMGALAVYLFERCFKPPVWLYLIVGVLCFLLKPALDVLLPVQDHPLLAGILLPYSGTFPVIPWLFLFFLGAYVYRIGPRWNFSWAAVSTLIFVALAMSGVNLEYRSKFDMSLGYFLLSCILAFALFLVFLNFKVLNRPSPFNPILFFGQNSLLFLFVHFAAIAFFSLQLQWEVKVPLIKHHPFLMWLLIFAVTWITMLILLYLAKINPRRACFDRIWVWVLLVALVWTVPLLPNNELVRWTAVGLGTVASLHYHQLSRALKGAPAQLPGVPS
ncbi:MAG TPA: heparan-alpha-glucosaminide N-acetyltransferase domain-containing protein [Anaerolineales bacterium]|nr:heparan-alpha-glucosaminide N-acetyltransferase domain-containing protein [Anaerolineales bacterium]